MLRQRPTAQAAGGQAPTLRVLNNFGAGALLRRARSSPWEEEEGRRRKEEGRRRKTRETHRIDASRETHRPSVIPSSLVVGFQSVILVIPHPFDHPVVLPSSLIPLITPSSLRHPSF